MNSLIVIDGNVIQTASAFHQAMKSALDFPDYYGMNPNALWDCLTDVLYSDQSIEILWKNYTKSVEHMMGDAEVLRQVFIDAQKEFPKLFQIAIED